MDSSAIVMIDKTRLIASLVPQMAKLHPSQSAQSDILSKHRSNPFTYAVPDRTDSSKFLRVRYSNTTRHEHQCTFKFFFSLMAAQGAVAAAGIGIEQSTSIVKEVMKAFITKYS